MKNINTTTFNILLKREIIPRSSDDRYDNYVVFLLMNTYQIHNLVKIAFDLKKIATEFVFPLSFRERPKIKYIKSLSKSTHGKDVI
jgi:hypothetical protein